MISILCVDRLTNYKKVPVDLDLWGVERDAFQFNGSGPVIAHPPCQQWSRLRAFSKPDIKQKELAFFCLRKVQLNGGVFEHPYGSSFFKVAGIKPTHCIDQSWFGFPARKRTWLYFVGCKPLQHPISFDAVLKNVSDLNSRIRSRMPVAMCDWLVRSVLTLERG